MKLIGSPHPTEPSCDPIRSRDKTDDLASVRTEIACIKAYLLAAKTDKDEDLIVIFENHLGKQL